MSKTTDADIQRPPSSVLRLTSNIVIPNFQMKQKLIKELRLVIHSAVPTPMTQ